MISIGESRRLTCIVPPHRGQCQSAGWRWFCGACAVGSEGWCVGASRVRASEQTFYRWKAKYGGLEVSDARRLRQLEEENRKLKQLVAEQALDIVGFKAVLSKKW